MEAMVQRLDRLMQDEARQAVAQILKVVHGLAGDMKVVMDGERMYQACRPLGVSPTFAPPPAQPEENEAPAGASDPIIMCKDTTFPGIEKSDNNIDILTAWREITSHPHFKASVSGALLSNGLPTQSVQ